MSGGLDSTVVAALLKERGYDIMGLTLHMFKEGSRCCSIEDIDRSRRICDLLDVPHATVNVIDYFRETIIEPFVHEYSIGRTPSPCVRCNQYVKFGALHTRALQLGCSHIATGHYVRIEKKNGSYHLLRARDRTKDQSYFLHRLTQDQLSRSLFPLESWKKSEVAAYAKEHNLPVSTSSTSESQDLCFVPDSGHGLFVEQHRPEVRRKGEIANTKGNVLGSHPGVHHFTVGQRKGIRVAASTRLYVKQIQAESNRIIVGDREDLFDTTCDVESFHWILAPPPTRVFSCQVRIRYRNPSVQAEVEIRSPDRIHLTLREPQFAIAPGQAAVLYDDDEVLGGGWIAS